MRISHPSTMIMKDKYLKRLHQPMVKKFPTRIPKQNTNYIWILTTILALMTTITITMMMILENDPKEMLPTLESYDVKITPTEEHVANACQAGLPSTKPTSNNFTKFSSRTILTRNVPNPDTQHMEMPSDQFKFLDRKI